VARRVFFSFHYQRDIWRVNQVRNAEVVLKRQKVVPFYDASIWEESEKHGSRAVRRLIDNGLKNTSVTCVLIGRETASRWWVLYEIAASLRRGNGLLGVRIHGLKDKDGRTDAPGVNPFSHLYERGGELYHVTSPFSARRICYEGEPLQRCDLTGLNFLLSSSLASRVRVYDWGNDGGYERFPEWVEAAYEGRGALV
jgi:hypothetical protein